MKKLYIPILLTILLLTLVGCGGGGGDVRPVYVAVILSDQPSDGDIAFDPVDQVITIANGPNTLFFGLDELARNIPEYRAFLDFPLDGSTDADQIPAAATIVRATLEVFVNEVNFTSVVPSLIDLVSYPLTGLRVEDFDSSPLLTQGVNFFASDQDAFVVLDVTPLMQEAQRLQLSDLQLRFLLDLDANSGFVGLEDRPNVSLTAPKLTVEYVL